MQDVKKKGSADTDEEGRSIIFEGANITQIGALFKMDHRTVQTKLFRGGVKPIKQTRNSRGQTVDLYSIAEVAPHLVKPIVDVEAYIRGMNHADLPKHLTKEFWAGQRSRQEYEKNAGLLWSTEEVITQVGELMKLVKMSTLLMNDAAERQTELTDRQQAIIRQLSHGMLEDLVKRIGEKFKVPEDVKRQEEDDNEEL